VAFLWQLIGWSLCFKVTYLYYRVSNSSPGVPIQVLKQNDSSRQKKDDDCLAVNADIARIYSEDIAEILRYSSIATNDLEKYVKVLSALPHSENAFCQKC